MGNKYGQQALIAKRSIRLSSHFGAVRNQSDVFRVTNSIALRLSTSKALVIHRNRRKPSGASSVAASACVVKTTRGPLSKKTSPDLYRYVSGLDRLDRIEYRYDNDSTGLNTGIELIGQD